MASFFSISMWIVLVTIIPGLVTIALLSAASFAVKPSVILACAADLRALNEWVFAGMAMTVMVLTQAFGILFEGFLVKHRLLGPEKKEIKIPPGIDPCGATEFELKPYEEYQGLYLLLAELRENEDTQGHLQRALAQFFLTNNTLISLAAGILFAIVLMWQGKSAHVANGFTYIAGLSVCLYVSFKVARVRFLVMAKALWASRRRRLASDNEEKTAIANP